MVKNVVVDKPVQVDAIEETKKHEREQEERRQAFVQRIWEYKAQFPNNRLPYTTEAYKIMYCGIIAGKLLLLHNFDKHLENFQDENYKLIEKSRYSGGWLSQLQSMKRILKFLLTGT